MISEPVLSYIAGNEGGTNCIYVSAPVGAKNYSLYGAIYYGITGVKLGMFLFVAKI